MYAKAHVFACVYTHEKLPPCMVGHTCYLAVRRQRQEDCNSITVGSLGPGREKLMNLWVQGQPDLRSEFKARRAYIVKIKNKTKQKHKHKTIKASTVFWASSLIWFLCTFHRANVRYNTETEDVKSRKKAAWHTQQLSSIKRALDLTVRQQILPKEQGTKCEEFEQVWSV